MRNLNLNVYFHQVLHAILKNVTSHRNGSAKVQNFPKITQDFRYLVSLRFKNFLYSKNAKLGENTHSSCF